MRLTIESTAREVTVNGIPCRVWQGKTDRGTACTVLVSAVVYDKNLPAEAAAEFAELVNIERPEVLAWPTGEAL